MIETLTEAMVAAVVHLKFSANERPPSGNRRAAPTSKAATESVIGTGGAQHGLDLAKESGKRTRGAGRSREVPLAAFLEIVIQIAAVLDVAAEESGHEQGVVADVFPDRAFVDDSGAGLRPEVRNQHLDHRAQLTTVLGAQLKQSIRAAEISQHRGDIVSNLRIAHPQLRERVAANGLKKL